MTPARGRTTRAWRSRIGGAQTEKPGRPRRGVIGAPRLNDGQIVVPRGAPTHTPNGRSSPSPDGGSIAAAFVLRCAAGGGRGAPRASAPRSVGVVAVRGTAQDRAPEGETGRGPANDTLRDREAGAHPPNG